MANKLNDEKLEKVNGGAPFASDEHLPNPHGIHIGMYQADQYEGRKFYIVNDHKEENYAVGILINSTELDINFGSTERCHYMQIVEIHGSLVMRNEAKQLENFTRPGTYWVSGDNSTLYLFD